MVTNTDIKAYRSTYSADSGRGPMDGISRVHMTLWSIFFAIAAIGGLMN